MPLKNPSVSVVMAVRDGAAFLAEAIESVREQSLADLELVVVDDGSSDETPEILDGFGHSDPRIRVLREDGGGVSHARNRGCREARGRYLAILDADDVALPRRLELQAAFLDANPEVAVVGGAGIFIDEEGVELGSARYPVDPAEVDALLRSGRVPIMQSAATIRAAAFEATSGYRPVMQVAEDFDLWLRMIRVGRITNLRDPVVRYRIHRGQTSIRNMRRTAVAVRAALASAERREKGRPDPLDEAESLDAALLDLLGVRAEEVAAQEVDYALWLARTLAVGGHHERAAPLWSLCSERAGDTATPRATRARVLRARADACGWRSRPVGALVLRARAGILEPRTTAARWRARVLPSRRSRA